MLQKNRRFKVFLNMLLEACIIFAAYRLSLFLRFSVMGGSQNAIYEEQSTEILIICYSLFTVFLFYLAHLYIPLHQLRKSQEIPRVILVSLVSLLILGAVLYLRRMEDISRVGLALFWLIFVTTLCIKRIVWRRISVSRYEKGVGIQRVILIGSRELAERFFWDICQYPQYGRRVIGYLGDTDSPDLGVKLGNLSEIDDILSRTPCEEIVVAVEYDESPYIQKALDAAGREGLRISMIPFYNACFPHHPTIETVGHSVMIDMRATPLDNLALAALKRAGDILGSLFLLILFSPLMLITALIVRLESPGPVFFRQKRVGLNRKEFMMMKFRSMKVNAEENTAWTRGKDPRRTKFGSFIRRYSIDELPQLFNVLKGDMSLVGPRPEIPFFVNRFRESVPLYLVRQQVRPGMTGWAQVHGLRGDTSIEGRVKYDIWYIENWSLWLDIRILFLTLLGGFINHEELPGNKKTDK